jgi:hypothetical protein
LSVFINDFNVITKVPEKQGQNLQNFPWPFCIGNKHKKPPRVFVLSLTILSPPPPPYSFFFWGGGGMQCQQHVVGEGEQDGQGQKRSLFGVQDCKIASHS